MINTQELHELIRTVLFSGYVAGEKPLSIMLVGNVGIGKSQLLNTYQPNENLAFFTDVTYMGIIKLLTEHKEVRHVVIPDFLKITMKKKSTTDNIISCLNAGIEEGIDKISLMGQSYDFKGKQFGIITATTSASYHQHKKTWQAMGLLSRMLIISYDYSDKTKEQIFDYIFKRKYLTDEKKEKLQLPIKNIEVSLSSRLAKKLKDSSTDFRKQKQLQNLAMARTLMNGNKNQYVVTMKEIQKVITLKKFMNLTFTKI